MNLNEILIAFNFCVCKKCLSSSNSGEKALLKCLKPDHSKPKTHSFIYLPNFDDFMLKLEILVLPTDAVMNVFTWTTVKNSLTTLVK